MMQTVTLMYFLTTVLHLLHSTLYTLWYMHSCTDFHFDSPTHKPTRLYVKVHVTCAQFTTIFPTNIYKYSKTTN